jgi:outer membrane protein
MKLKWLLALIASPMVLSLALRAVQMNSSTVGSVPLASDSSKPSPSSLSNAGTSASPPPASAGTPASPETSSSQPPDFRPSAPEAEPDKPEQAETNSNPNALTLDDALAIACKNSPMILEAEQAIKLASGFTVQTRALAMPALELSVNGAQADKYNTSNPGGQSDEVNVPTTQDRSQPAGAQWTVQLKLVKTIFDAGEARNQIGAAKISEAMATYGMEDTIQSVNLQVRQLYYQVLYLQQRVIIYRDAIALLGKQTARVKNQMQFGGSNEFNLLRAQAGLDSMEPLEVEAQAAYETGLQQLASLLGMDYEEAQQRLFAPGVQGKLLTKVDAPTLVEALKHAVNDRPAIHQLEMAVEAERLDMRAEAAAYYPRISLFSAIGHSDSPAPPSAGLTNNNDGYIVGVSGTWNIFDGGLVKGRVMQAHAQFNTALDALEAARSASEFDIREALDNLAFYQRDVNSHDAVWERARKCDNVAVERAAAGTGTIYDLIQTLQITTATRALLLNQLYQLNAIRAQIDYLTGHGVRISHDN